MTAMKTFYVRTYGCQMNELDSEIMAGLLSQRGLIQTEDEETADLLIFNTCSIRDLAERKVMGKLGQLGRAKKRNRIIGVTGCMANAKKESLFRKLPHVDFVLGIILLLWKDLNLKAGWFHLKMTGTLFLIVCDVITGRHTFRLSRSPIFGKGIKYKFLHGMTAVFLITVLVSIYIFKQRMV